MKALSSILANKSSIIISSKTEQTARLEINNSYSRVKIMLINGAINSFKRFYAIKDGHLDALRKWRCFGEEIRHRAAATLHLLCFHGNTSKTRNVKPISHQTMVVFTRDPFQNVATCFIINLSSFLLQLTPLCHYPSL